MSIAVGDRLPSVILHRMTDDGVRTVSTDEYFAGRTVVLLGVPGAFTPTCHDTHLPGFVVHSEDLLARGVDAIACTAVNDVFVMTAWGEATGASEWVEMLADGNGDLARALGLAKDSSAWGMGLRSRRYAAVVDDGEVIYLGVEPGGEVGVSGADAVLAALD